MNNISVSLLLRYAKKYVHDVHLITTSDTEAYLLAKNPYLPCPRQFRVMVSKKVSPRYAQNAYYRALNHKHDHPK